MKHHLLILAIAMGVFAMSAAATAEIIEFRIPAGTGEKSWNKFDHPVHVRVGDTLRIVNDDTDSHFLHTLGKPCEHGTRAFEQGESYDCVIKFPHASNAGDVYDHLAGSAAQFYIQAD